jgi:hypothetical protein
MNGFTLNPKKQGMRARLLEYLQTIAVNGTVISQPTINPNTTERVQRVDPITRIKTYSAQMQEGVLRGWSPKWCLVHVFHTWVVSMVMKFNSRSALPAPYKVIMPANAKFPARYSIVLEPGLWFVDTASGGIGNLVGRMPGVQADPLIAVEVDDEYVLSIANALRKNRVSSLPEAPPLNHKNLLSVDVDKVRLFGLKKAVLFAEHSANVEMKQTKFERPFKPGLAYSQTNIALLDAAMKTEAMDSAIVRDVSEKFTKAMLQWQTTPPDRLTKYSEYKWLEGATITRTTPIPYKFVDERPGKPTVPFSPHYMLKPEMVRFGSAIGWGTGSVKNKQAAAKISRILAKSDVNPLVDITDVVDIALKTPNDIHRRVLEYIYWGLSAKEAMAIATSADLIVGEVAVEEQIRTGAETDNITGLLNFGLETAVDMIAVNPEGTEKPMFGKFQLSQAGFPYQSLNISLHYFKLGMLSLRLTPILERPRYTMILVPRETYQKLRRTRNGFQRTRENFTSALLSGKIYN